MVEGPENAVHPKLMENLLLTIQAYTSNTDDEPLALSDARI